MTTLQNAAPNALDHPSVEATPGAQSASDPIDRHVPFDLGWDIAYYGLPCDLEDAAIRAGYLAGKERFKSGARREADRFIRKWLQLRTNAWRRGRVFSDEVTPAYLKRIDAKSCPITGIELTHGTELLTDASIDRVNNDGAYAIGNLAVMSTQANKAKSNLSFADVIERIANPTLGPSLSPQQWLRMASLMEGPCSLNGTTQALVPFSLNAIRGVRVTRSQALQFVLRLEVYNYRNVHIIRPIRKTSLVIADRKGFDGLVKRLRKRRAARTGPQEFWWNDSLFSAFSSWYTKLHPQSLANIEGVLLARTKFAPGAWDVQSWCLDSLGYYDSQDSPEEAPESEDLPEEVPETVSDANECSLQDLEDFELELTGQFALDGVLRARVAPAA
jgi:hypothetical protein